MKTRRAGLLLLGIQLILVLSIAGKYLYERKVCPRVWVRTAQYDPQMPLRGRYFALQPSVNACHLPHDAAHFQNRYGGPHGGGMPGTWRWRVSLHPENGVLIAHNEDNSVRTDDTYEIMLLENQRCDVAAVQAQLLYFIPEHAVSPFPVKHGTELWVEVTMPPSGPPRPIQLALSDVSGFRPLKFD